MLDMYIIIGMLALIFLIVLVNQIQIKLIKKETERDLKLIELINDGHHPEKAEYLVDNNLY